MIAAWTTGESLAVARLRQWAAERRASMAGKTTNYQRIGWQTRNTRSFDSKLVRVLDFERALASLDAEEQVVLVLTYRDRERADAVALALGCSIRKISYLLPAARRKLADVLDRLDLL